MTARRRKIRHPGPIIAKKEYPHGTNAKYALNLCRCDDCRRAHNEYEQRRWLWQGEFPRVPPPLVDARPARRHVRVLMRQGMSHKRIAALAGVPASAVGTLIWGRYDRAGKRIRTTTAAKLFAVDLDLADGANVPADEAKEIIAELIARGWTKTAIGQRVHGPQAKSLQVAKRAYVYASTLRTLRQLMTEPVPLRRHSSGHTYKPTGRPPRPVVPYTAGVPSPIPPPTDIKPKGPESARKLKCEICGRPLIDHRLTERCA